VDPVSAIDALQQFSSDDLTSTLSQIEGALEGASVQQCKPILVRHNAQHDVLAAAGQIKRLAGQINVVIHALGILLCLPELLYPDETIQAVSLGAGNTGKPFDLVTDRRVAEFKFISWQGGPESIRQNSIFKDFYYLAEDRSSKSKHLYVLGSKYPLKFFTSRRALDSVLSRNVTFSNEFRSKYPDCEMVCDYYMTRRHLVQIEDVSPLLPGLANDLHD
jgi:hypothetical protein